MLEDLEDASSGCTPPKVKSVRAEKNVENTRMESEDQFLNHQWHGIPLENLKVLNLNNVYPPVKPSEDHTVLFKVPVVPNQTPHPYPEKFIDVWDKDHVRLPCSSRSLAPVAKTELRNRWDLIHEVYSVPIKSSQQLEAAILHYNSKYAERWSFKALHYFFSTTLQEEETEHFFLNIFPGIVRLALSLPNVLTGAIPLLRQQHTHSISLTQRQIASLLANAFLCTFPRRNTARSVSEYKNYPDINFNRLYNYGLGESSQEKLKCIVNYFRRVSSNCPEGVVTYSRHYVAPNLLPVWRESGSVMPQLHITSIGSIEDQGTGMMELDFANKFVGGGVLGRGCVQEEIRFVICPELIVAKLFTEFLDDTEALIVTGIERYNNYKGYSRTFTWAGDYKDQTPRDCYGRRLCVILAIDAFKFQYKEKQYTPSSINRELNKAYAGFSWGLQTGDPRLPRLSVATGNWGCGAFGGNALLKALLQLMVAGQTNRGVAYFTFGDPDLCSKIGDMHKFLVNNNVTVGHLWNLLYNYHCSRSQKSDLYSYLYHSVSNGNGSGNEKTNTNKKIGSASLLIPDLSTSIKGSSSACGGLSSKEIAETLVSLDNDSDFSEAVENIFGTYDKPNSESSISKSEPLAAKSYSVKSKEGLDICLKIQNDSWARIEESRKDFNEFEIIDDDMASGCIHGHGTKSSTTGESDKEKQSPIVKRKISDYFSTTPKV